MYIEHFSKLVLQNNLYKMTKTVTESADWFFLGKAFQSFSALN